MKKVAQFAIAGDNYSKSQILNIKGEQGKKIYKRYETVKSQICEKPVDNL
jgi:hypothetical protein